MSLIKNMLKKWLEKIDSNSKMLLLKWMYKNSGPLSAFFDSKKFVPGGYHENWLMKAERDREFQKNFCVISKITVRDFYGGYWQVIKLVSITMILRTKVVYGILLQRTIGSKEVPNQSLCWKSHGEFILELWRGCAHWLLGKGCYIVNQECWNKTLKKKISKSM